MATTGNKWRDATMDEAWSALREDALVPAVRLLGEAADTIDALVAALEEARDTFEGIRYDGQYQANNETMRACRDAVDRIDAALALARPA